MSLDDFEGYYSIFDLGTIARLGEDIRYVITRIFNYESFDPAA